MGAAATSSHSTLRLTTSPEEDAIFTRMVCPSTCTVDSARSSM
jgi:hypothetical protein